jgi:hypothetical protein
VGVGTQALGRGRREEPGADVAAASGRRPALGPVELAARGGDLLEVRPLARRIAAIRHAGRRQLETV